MKMINLKRKLTYALIVGLIFCLSFFILPLNSSAKANTSYEPVDGVAVSGFYMENGAEVRLDGKQGIRFITNVEKGFYDYLKTTYGEQAEIEFHTLINYNGLDVLEITPTNTTQDLKFSGNANFDGTENTSSFQYKATVVYNGDSAEGVTEEVKRAAYSLELTARAYVKIGENVIYAKAEDTSRSMKGVASVAYLTEDDQENIGYLENYLVGEGKTIGALSETVSGFYGDKYVGGATYDATQYAQSGVVKVKDVTVVEAYLGANKLKVTDNGDGTQKISGFEFADSALRTNKVLTVFGSNGNAYRFTYKIVDRIITVKDELSAFKMTSATDKFGGYYVLGNDIDATGYSPVAHDASIANLTSSTISGLTGTFDGNGHSIINFTSTTGQYGLFGRVFNGTIKNLAFKNAVLNTGKNTETLFATYATGVNMENVYVDLALNSSGNFIGGLFFDMTNNYTNTIKNCVFKVTAATPTCNFYKGSLIGQTANVPDSSKWENVYMISSLELANKFSASQVIDASNTTATTKLANVYRYATAEDMAKAGNSYSSFTGVWKIGNGIPVWHDTKVVSDLKEVYAYSQTEKAAFIPETSAAYGFTEVESETAGYTAELTQDGLVISKEGSSAFDASGETINLIAKKGEVYYRFGVKIATHVIDDASELAVFNLATTTTTFPDYYMLAKSINAETYTHPAHAAVASVTNAASIEGLTGTFDGNGYTISNLNLSNGDGLFGSIKGGTVKNVAFVGASSRAVTPGKYPVLLAGVVNNTSITNVYADVTIGAVRAWNGTLFYQVGGTTKLTNCIIKSTGGASGSYYGSIAGSGLSNGMLSNVYAISTTKIQHNSSAPLDAKIVDGETTSGTLTNVQRYTTEDKMNAGVLADANKANVFEAYKASGLWNVNETTGAITFKTK